MMADSGLLESCGIYSDTTKANITCKCGIRCKNLLNLFFFNYHVFSLFIFPPTRFSNPILDPHTHFSVCNIPKPVLLPHLFLMCQFTLSRQPHWYQTRIFIFGYAFNIFGLPDPDRVQEFYANLWDNKTSVVYVRGRMVPFSAKAINKFFSLTTPNTDGYTTTLAAPTDAMFEQLLHIVAVDDTTCTYSHTQRIRSCKCQDLRPEAKLWFYLIRHTLMPTGHVSTINQERLLLISTIMDSTPINVGSLLEA